MRFSGCYSKQPYAIINCIVKMINKNCALIVKKAPKSVGYLQCRFGVEVCMYDVAGKSEQLYCC